MCRACERWNLTPLDERWEAIEECEQLFRRSMPRAATGEIAIARVDATLDLVRLGRPGRLELAAWRWGDQFGRRRRRHAIRIGLGVGAASAVVGGVLLLGGSAAAVSLGGLYWLGRGAELAYRRVTGTSEKSVVARPIGDDLRPLTVQHEHLSRIWLETDRRRESVVLAVAHEHGTDYLRGEPLIAALRLLLPAINAAGATPAEVRRAVDATAEFDTGSLLSKAAAHGDRGEALRALPLSRRFALEMSLHEQLEQLATNGELAALESAWRHAEEIAAIADDLLLPNAVDRKLKELRQR